MKNRLFTLSFFRPIFLENLNRYLLVNYPRLWDSRIHYILFYGLLANIITSLLVQAMFQPRLFDRSPEGTYSYHGLTRWIWPIIILEIIITIFWLYRQTSHKIEIEFGNTNNIMGAFDIFIYAACSLVIFSSSLTALVIGANKSADQYNIDRNTVCESPTIRAFYHPDDLSSNTLIDVESLNRALALAEETMRSGKAKAGTILIEEAVVRKDEFELEKYGSGSTVSLYGYQETKIKVIEIKISIEDGEAKITSQRGPITINSQTIISNGNSAIVKKGDILTLTDYFDTIKVDDGSITIRPYAKYEIDDQYHVIQQKGNALIMAQGNTNVELNGGLSFLLNDRAYDACMRLKYLFSSNSPRYSSDNLDALHISAFFGWHVFFVVFAAYLLFIIKHYLWTDSEISYLILYWFSQLIFVYLFADIFLIDTFGLAKSFGLSRLIERIGITFSAYATRERDLAQTIIFLVSFLAYSFIQFKRLSNILKTTKFRRISLFRLVSFPIESGAILLFTTFRIAALAWPGYQISGSLFVLALIFLCMFYFMLQKRIFIHLISLPKDK